MKTFILLCFSLFLINISSQDYPPSVGPAPLLNNNIPTSEQVVHSANPNNRALTIIAAGATTNLVVNKHYVSSCSLTQVGPAGAYFAGAITRVANNKYYILDQIGVRLIRTDTLNVQVTLGAITGLPLPNITGMTWDATTGTMYVITTTLTSSQIGILDTVTRVVTGIGDSSSVCKGAISISCAPNGSLFVIDIVNDNLYKVNKITGVFTMIGPLGVSINFGQDAQFDVDGMSYWAAYTSGPQLRIIDTTTGSSTFVCVVPGTQAEAIATIPSGLTAIEPTGTVIPQDYFINQNYPNPFNPSTKIKFGLPENNNVKLTVYDVLGKEVSLLVNEFRQSGTYEIDFDGTNLPSGLYFYKLEAGEFTQTKKMLLIK